MFAVYAAEQQYRHDTRVQDREHALIASIRERETAALTVRRPVRAVARPERLVWARPIGLHVADDHPAACAVA